MFSPEVHDEDFLMYAIMQYSKPTLECFFVFS